MNIDFSGPRPVLRRGLLPDYLRFMSGRMSLSVAPHGGITAIKYYGEDIGGTPYFQADPISAFGKLFRFQFVIDGTPYFPEFNKTEIFARGMVSCCRLAGVELQYELWGLEDALVQRYKVLDNPRGKEVAGRLLFHRHLAHGTTEREWGKPKMANGGLEHMVTVGEKEVGIRTAGDASLKIRSCNEDFMFYMDREPGPSGAFFTAFALGMDAARRRAKVLANAAQAECDVLLKNQEAEYRALPKIHSGDTVLDNALGNVIPSVSALEVASAPGAIRASQDYWVWGWDSMVHADAMLFANRSDIVRRMLDFYREKADPEKGVAHAFGVDFSIYLHMACNAQCIYVTTLYNYLAATGEWKKSRVNYDFACQLVERTLATLEPKSSLGLGRSLFPDFPQLLGETLRDDLASFNNSLFYQALRSLAAMASEYGDAALAERSSALAVKVADGIRKYLYDAEKGYWVDSASATDFSMRKHYPVYAILWVTPFANELCAGIETPVGRFMEKNFPYDCGLYMLPPWDSGFMADGNQLGAYYPPVDRLYWNMRREGGKNSAFRDFRRVVGAYWKKLTYPEGHTHETGNAEPALDNPGGRQAFSAKAWYCDFLELALGMTMDHKGLTFDSNPLLQGEVMQGLVLRGKSISIRVSGRGTLQAIRLNGKKITGSAKLPWEMLEKENSIELMLGKSPVLRLRRADAMGTQIVSSSPSRLRLTLDAPAGGLLYFTAPKQPLALLDGKACEISYEPSRCRGYIVIPRAASQTTLELKCK